MNRAAKIALALALGAFAAQSPPALREAAWTERDGARAHNLTHAPGECLSRISAEIEIGRALFRSPTLLGGPVARLGMSCNSCHLNGRANAHFLLPELTDTPGSADVTSEWASAVRGDGVMNPRRIPDLAGVAQRSAFGAGREPSLERFVRGVIVEEFQGPEPPPAAFAALIAYLRALEADCRGPETPLTLAAAADDVRRAYLAAVAAAPHSDRASASLAVLATQEALGLIVERLPDARFADDRRALTELARDLVAVRNAPDIAAALSARPDWRMRFDAAMRKLLPRARATYFDEASLARAL